MIAGFIRGAHAVAQVAAISGLAALMLLALAMTGNILMRWLFAAPMHGVDDLGRLVTAMAIASALPVCLIRRGNIVVDILGLSLTRLAGSWSYRLLEIVGALVTLILVALMCWQIGLFAAENTRAGATTQILGLPTGPFWYGVAGFFALAVFAQTMVVLSLLLPKAVEGRVDD